VSRLRSGIVSALVLLLGRGRPPRRRTEERPLVEQGAPNPRAEIAALTLLGLSALSAIAFVLVYAFASHLPVPNQLLGLTLGGAFILFAAALIVVALKLVPDEEVVEAYPPWEHPGEQQVLGEVLEESGSRFTRAGLFKLGLFGAGGALGLAILAPAVSFGPLFSVKEFFTTPWRRGRRLVDESGKPWKAADIEEQNFYTAFPEGGNDEELGASLIVVRLPTSELALPSQLAGYDAGGIVAYSKICTHAGCAISMYRAPLFQPDSPRPALVCPCHYSTFDPARGGTVLFGPAGRPLPMLPLEVDAKGYLRAKGNFSGAVGPSWWGVRNRKPTS
jgi:ubiquinol-cytochrome c reductase iron-sulfur subunit